MVEPEHPQLTIAEQCRLLELSCPTFIAIERFWRTLKQDEVYLRDYESLPEARHYIGEYIRKYNEERPHSSIGGRTPQEVYSNIGSRVAA